MTKKGEGLRPASYSMEITKQEKILYYRKILLNKENSKIIRDNARNKLLELLK